MPHGLLLAKLNAYGMSLNACEMLKSYLVSRQQRVRIGNNFSEWTTSKKGVPQGSILGPLLFNIFINDFLFSKMNSKVYNYADDNTLSYTSSDVQDIMTHLKLDCLQAVEWFNLNNMKANPDKFQLMFLNEEENPENLVLNINNNIVKATTSINILGLDVDNRLNFNCCIDNTCNQTSKQINALKRIKHYMDRKCKTMLYNSYVSSNFNYCPLVWMFSGKTNGQARKDQ